MVRMGHTLSKADWLAIEGLVQVVAQAQALDARRLRQAVEQLARSVERPPSMNRTGTRALALLSRLDQGDLITNFASHGFQVVHRGGNRPYSPGGHSFVRREVFNYLCNREWIVGIMPPNTTWSLMTDYTISALGRTALQRYQAALMRRMVQERLDAPRASVTHPDGSRTPGADWDTPPTATPGADIRALLEQVRGPLPAPQEPPQA